MRSRKQLKNELSFTKDRLCDWCLKEDLWLLCGPEENDSARPLENVGTMRSNHNCPLCRLVIHAIQPWELIKAFRDTTYPRLSRREAGRISITCPEWPYNIGVLHIINLKEKIAEPVPSAPPSRSLFKRTKKLLSKSDPSNELSSLSTAPLPPSSSQGVDFSMFRSLIENCESDHSGCYSNNTSDMETILIDISNQNLTKYQTGFKYAALSYVWGTVPTLRTTLATLPALNLRGSLTRLKNQIPHVILDTMDATKALGYRYLWVDTLCIVQDDDQEKRHQLAQMHRIYANSQVTIVALHGTDANASLRGITLKEPQYQGSFKDLDIELEPPPLAPLLKAAYYNTRAWTYQERLLSRRCLFFAERQIYFQCRTEICCEDGKPRDDFGPGAELSETNPLIENRPPPKYPLPKRDIPINVYQLLVEQYTTKNLTFVSDRVNAFQGIMTAHGTTYGSFWCGLPEKIFDIALLWIPLDMHSMQSKPLLNGESHNEFPSWSWTSWQGPIIHPMKFINEFHPALTTPIQLIYVTEGSASMNLVNRDKVSYEQLENHANPQLEESPINIYPNSLVFTTSTASLMPIPSSDSTTSQQLYLGNIVTIKIRDGVPATRLFLGNDVCGFLFGNDLNCPIISKDKYELILLSTVERFSLKVNPSYWEEYDGGKEAFPEYPWCVQNIMLIRWEGAYARRVTIGVVHRDAWMSVAREGKQIILS